MRPSIRKLVLAQLRMILTTFATLIFSCNLVTYVLQKILLSCTQLLKMGKLCTKIGVAGTLVGPIKLLAFHLQVAIH